jgi:hypothetical protein
MYNSGGTTWSVAMDVTWNAFNMTTVRKAYTSDYNDVVMNSFSNILGCSTGSACQHQPPTGTCTSWGSEGGTYPDCCASEPCLTNIDVMGGVILMHGGPTYKIFLHEGQCHAEREQDGNPAGCNYDDMHSTMGSVTTYFKDWTRAWAQVPGFNTWDNINP